MRRVSFRLRSGRLFALGAAAALVLTVGTLPCWADSSQTLTHLLDLAAGQVTSFLDELADVECTEMVTQLKMGKNDKPEVRTESTYDYVVLPQLVGGKPELVESRLAKKQAKGESGTSLLVTNGFSSLLLVFHPYYQAGFEYAEVGDETVNGAMCTKLRFQHIKGLRTTAALLVRDREYPLDLEGFAWIEHGSGAIVRMTAQLESPLDDIGLHQLQTQVDYGPVVFQGLKQTYWMPVTAVIDVESSHQHWRNLHQFASYHRFSTSVKSTVGQVQ